MLWSSVKYDIVPPEQTMEFYIGLKRNDLSVIALFYHSGKTIWNGIKRNSRHESTRMVELFFKNKTSTSWICNESSST